MRLTRRLYQRFRVLIHEAAKFGVVGLAGFIVSLGGADVLRYGAGMGKYKAIVVDGVGLKSGIWYNLANVAGIGLGTLFRFWSYRKWVWRTQEPASGVPASGHRPVSPAPGFPEAAVVEAVAVGLDEEATLYGRGAENYDETQNYDGAEGYRADSYRGGAENYGRPESYGPGTGDHGRGGEGTGNGTRPSGPRHAAKQRS